MRSEYIYPATMLACMTFCEVVGVDYVAGALVVLAGYIGRLADAD